MKKFLRQRGQAAVEFTLLLPFFAMILFATIYIGMFVLDYVTLDNAAAKASRHAALDPEHELRTEDKTNIENTKLFLSWYELKKDTCTNFSRGNINEITGAFEVASGGGYVQVMIQAKLKSTKQDTILKNIVPNAYTVSKVAEIP